MLFNSLEFIFFFVPVVFLGYLLLSYIRKDNLAQYWLIGCSLFFYSYWNINYLPLILLSILVNYSLVIHINRDNIYKKRALYLGVLFNLSLLGYFKYYDFFIESLNIAFSTSFILLELALPLAISFFTLQQIAYLFDSYNGKVTGTSFTKYVLFVTFFPQLIAGPIVHYKEMVPQFQKKFIINFNNIAIGLFIFSIGLFKKVVLADSFAIYANFAFNDVEKINQLEAWIGSFAYTLQLYFDFSGYSDMAIGLALLFNILLPINFNSPYRSRNIIEFWSKWHITLTRFINAYLFNPIVKSYKMSSFNQMMLVTLLTMILVGFWHGANWTFILFGFIHGTALIINHLMKKYHLKLHKLLAWFLTFNFINFSLVLFRSDSLDTSVQYLIKMFDFSNSDFLYRKKIWLQHFMENFVGEFHSIIFPLLFLAIGLLIIYYKNNSITILKNLQKLDKFNWVYLFAFIFLLGCSLNFLFLSTGSEFLYFNF